MKAKKEEKIKLSHAAIKSLNTYNIKGNKELISVNFIFQIYQCYKLSHLDYYSSTLFDDENICNNFILKYNKNNEMPIKGDIISISKIEIIILPDQKHLLYKCKDINILQKNSKFLIDPDSLIRASTVKKSLNIKFIDNINNKSQKEKFLDIKEKEEEKEIFLDIKEKKEEKKEINKIIKVFILLFINEQNNYINNNIKKYEKLVLLNKNIIDQYIKEYNIVKNLIKKNLSSIIKNIREIGDKYLPLNLSNLDIIISNLDKNLLYKIDKMIEEQNFNISLNPNFKIIQLIDKKIKIYKDIILVDEHIFNYINKIFDNSIIKENVYYLSKIDQDLIAFENNLQYTIIVRKIDKEKYCHNIKYIFDYNSYFFYTKEKAELIKCNIKDYICNKMVFCKNINYEDCISPIFLDNDIIGYCYKYYSDIINYNLCMNYYNYLSNENLLKSINLFFNYQRINNQLKKTEKKNIIEKFYLVNNEYIKDMKNECNFNIINKLLEQNNIIENDNNFKKKILSVIKNIPNNELIKITGKIKAKNRSNIEPKITTFDYIDKSTKFIMIYDNFEIVHVNRMEKLKILKNINDYNYIVECIINDGKIIINYNNLNVNNYVSVIGKLNEENSFITEYVLIYANKNNQYKHINSISGKLSNYLKRLKLINNSQIIIGDNNKEIGIIVKRYISFIKSNFNISPKIGLQNIGATCYMNATLQCFCHIEKFVNFFKSSQQAINIYNNNKNTLSYSFKLLIDELWPNDYNKYVKGTNYYYPPEEFKKKISQMNPLFKGIAANDAKDLVNFIIMTLHEELNKANYKNDEYNKQILDQRNKQLIFNNFAKYFMANNQSIISDLFYAMNYTITECLVCHTKLYNYQTYFFIVFPLEEVRKFKYENQFSFMMNFFNISFNNNKFNNVVSIYDCFEYDKKINMMCGSNSIYCNICKANCNGSMTTYICTGPEILILLLNRGKGIEFNVKIDFGEELNLYNYIEYKQLGFNYKLIGVITHIGESSMSGHFIAYCRDPISDKWFKYNDAIVTEVIDFYNEVINFAMPYLLFYQKNN